MNFCYKFPVVKGLQAGREYYIAMVPLRMISSMFPNEEEYVLPEHRAQRRINEVRIPEIKKYMLENRDSYVFSALAASIDGEYRFVPSDQEDLGILEVSLDAHFLINDGQHRKAAILAAVEEEPELGNETISVVFYEDLGLKRSQQMFTDLNKHAVKTSNSISELYDSRDDLAVATRNIVKAVPFLDEYVDKEKDILGKYSSSLFTLNNMYMANKRILKRNACDESFVEFCTCFWTSVAEHMLPWKDLQNRSISKMELREKYIATQAVIIQAIGRVGGCLIEHKNEYNLDKTISKIELVDWKRTAPEWQKRVIKPNGRMITSEKAILLAANNIKKKLDLPLTEDEEKAEHELLA